MLSDICNDDCLVELFIDFIENIKKNTWKDFTYIK